MDAGASVSDHRFSAFCLGAGKDRLQILPADVPDRLGQLAEGRLAGFINHQVRVVHAAGRHVVHAAQVVNRQVEKARLGRAGEAVAEAASAEPAISLPVAHDLRPETVQDLRVGRFHRRIPRPAAHNLEMVENGGGKIGSRAVKRLGKNVHIQIAKGGDQLEGQDAPAGGLGKIRFHDYNLAYDSVDLPNVNLFQEQIELFKRLLATATPSAEQQKDVDFLLALGELFALVVYGQLILEAAPIHGVDDDAIDQIFDFMVRDFSAHALTLYSKPSSTEAQMALCQQMLRRPVVDHDRYMRVWQIVHGLDGRYEMNA